MTDDDEYPADWTDNDIEEYERTPLAVRLKSRGYDLDDLDELERDNPYNQWMELD